MVDRAATRQPLSAAVEAAFAHGVDWLQLRERELAGGALHAWASELAAAAGRGAAHDGREALVLVNRRLDVALSIGAGGAHLGFDALGVADARHLLGPHAVLGVSTHSLAEVDAAAQAGADYVHLAPVFEPLSKRATRPPLGLEAVRAASQRGIRVIAQGGVREGNASALLEAGAAGLAVTGAVLMADDPGRAARALRAALATG